MAQRKHQTHSWAGEASCQTGHRMTSRWAHQKHKSHSTTTSKEVAPHLEQVPSFLEWVTDKSLQPDDAMINDEPASDATGLSTQPKALVDDTAVLPYDDDELGLSVW